MGNSRLTPAQAERRAQVVRMRSARLSFAEIGRRLDITAQRAGVIYRQALMDVPKANVDEHRAEELEFIDLATNRLLTIAMDSAVTPRTRVEAWSAIRGWAERKAKLLGLDAPTKHEVLTIDGIEAEIRRLELELSVNDTPATKVTA
jgi:hypothetical protein